MPCIICKSENLYPSNILTIEERRGILEDVQCFMLCKGCGNVMMKTTANKIIGTDHIRDKEVITLAYKKLFGSSSFNGRKPSQYGFTRNGEKFSTSELNTVHAIKEEDGLTYVNHETQTVDNVEEKSYPHVDNSNVRVGFFGKLKQFVKNLFSKAS